MPKSLLLSLILGVACAPATIELPDRGGDGGAGGDDAGTPGGDTGAGPDGDGGGVGDGGDGDGGGGDGGGGDGGGGDGGGGEHDGVYAGTLVLTAVAVDFPDSPETCTGPISLEVAAGAAPQIAGEATCTFTGTLAWLGEQVVAVTGDTTAGAAVGGTLSATLNGTPLEAPWTGTWAGDSLAGSFAGATAVDLWGWVLDVEIDGSFTATRG